MLYLGSNPALVNLDSNDLSVFLTAPEPSSLLELPIKLVINPESQDPCLTSWIIFRVKLSYLSVHSCLEDASVPFTPTAPMGPTSGVAYLP